MKILPVLIASSLLGFYACQPACAPCAEAAPDYLIKNPEQRPKLTIKDWLGTYEGTLRMYNVKQPDSPHLVALKLEVAETEEKGRWTWRTSFKSSIYGDAVKDYELVQPDSLVGTPFFWTDEGNEVLIHNTYYDNTFYNSFSLSDGATIQCVFKRYENKLFYDIFTSTTKPNYSKDMGDYGTLKTHPILVSQSAVLVKK